MSDWDRLSPEKCGMAGCSHTFIMGQNCEGDSTRVCESCCTNSLGEPVWRPVYEIMELGVLT